LKENFRIFSVPPFVEYQLPAIIYAMAIFVVSSIPYAQPPPLGIVYEDKWIHLLEYGGLGFLVARAFYFQNRHGWLRRRWFWMAVLATFAYGITDEIHQWFVPGRYADILDAVADGLGGLLGAYFFSRYLKWKELRMQKTSRKRNGG